MNVELESTYKNFLPLANICKEKKEDLVKAYQLENDPTILAKIFVSNYNLIIKESSKYFGLSNWDVSSFAVEELHKTLLAFDFTKQASFITYYCTCLRNRLRTETESLSYQKRKSNTLCNEYDDKNVGAQEQYFAINLISVIEGDNRLTDREKKYCIYIINDTPYTKDKDFSLLEGISGAAVCYIKKSLQIKLNYLLLA